jgi:hypothetical protein
MAKKIILALIVVAVVVGVVLVGGNILKNRKSQQNKDLKVVKNVPCPESFNPEKVSENFDKLALSTKDLLGQYFFCKAALDGDKTICGKLPPSYEKSTCEDDYGTGVDVFLAKILGKKNFTDDDVKYCVDKNIFGIADLEQRGNRCRTTLTAIFSQDVKICDQETSDYGKANCINVVSGKPSAGNCDNVSNEESKEMCKIRAKFIQTLKFEKTAVNCDAISEQYIKFNTLCRLHFLSSCDDFLKQLRDNYFCVGN